MKVISLSIALAGIALLAAELSFFRWEPQPSIPPHSASTLRASSPKLSESPALPSPALQLKQTMTAGQIETRTPSLPLIRGDLQQFSDKNLDSDLPPSPKLIELKQRLQRLQSMQRNLDRQE